MKRRPPRISPSEPVSEVRRVPIVECGEPLVPYLEVCPGLLVDPPRFDYERVHYLRKTVAEMLCRAVRSLPKGYRLSIIEGWRPPHIQRRMYLAIWQRFKERHPDWSDLQLKRVVNRYTAPVDSPKVPPPHTTGAAIDVVLASADGAPLDLRSPFEWQDPRSFPLYAKGLSEKALTHRRIMAEALERAGLTNYPSEFWHWSYGDQGWAYRTANDHAIYGPTQPEGWQPNLKDVADEALTWVFDPSRYALDPSRAPRE
jgi:D-alanyl-D-alanine dipeptidase